MSFKKTYTNLFILISLAIITIFSGCKEDDTVNEQTRLFKPVTKKDLYAVGNTVVVELGEARDAAFYQVQISIDSFKTVTNFIQSDSSTIIFTQDSQGEELFWNTTYQIRAQAFADDPQYNSLLAELGNVRTEKFPSNLIPPTANDVIDIVAKVSWERVGAKITQVRVFDVNDIRLSQPLIVLPVDEIEESSGTKFVNGLNPETSYQIAIYSDEDIRGWEKYTTVVQLVDKSLPNVIDLTANADPGSLQSAYLTSNEGDIIVLKKGRTYDLPNSDNAANHSITIIGDLGFEDSKAKLYTTGNWNIVPGSDIDHIRFINVEIEGEDMGGDYVFNPNLTGETHLRELYFEDCIINNVRGVIRIRSDMFLGDYSIRNSFVHHLGNYGIITCDTDGDGKAAVENILLENSTFSHVTVGIQTRQNTQSVTIDGCTFFNFPFTGSRIFRYRGGDGFDQSINGISISNSIFGHSWDPEGTGIYDINAIDGLESTTISVTNVHATNDFAVSEGDEIPGFPNFTYSSGDADLWVNPEMLDFNFLDTSFDGRTDSGDPRWRSEF